MKTTKPSRLLLLLTMAFAMFTNAQADTVDVSAGWDNSTPNSYFKIDNNTGFDLSNLVFSATSNVTDPSATGYGWNNQWSVTDVAAGAFGVFDFNQATGAFKANFASYANSIVPTDINYALDGVLNSQAIHLAFSGQFDGPFFLGLDGFGNATQQNDFGQLASLSVAAVPLPASVYLFASSLLGVMLGRKRQLAV